MQIFLLDSLGEFGNGMGPLNEFFFYGYNVYCHYQHSHCEGRSKRVGMVEGVVFFYILIGDLKCETVMELVSIIEEGNLFPESFIMEKCFSLP